MSEEVKKPEKVLSNEIWFKFTLTLNAYFFLKTLSERQGEWVLWRINIWSKEEFMILYLLMWNWTSLDWHVVKTTRKTRQETDWNTHCSGKSIKAKQEPAVKSPTGQGWGLTQSRSGCLIKFPLELLEMNTGQHVSPSCQGHQWFTVNHCTSIRKSCYRR